MASTKLTNQMRERIVGDLLVHRFRKMADKLVKDRAAFALKLYREVYPRSILAKMDAMPDGWLPTDNDIQVRLGLHYDRFSLSGAMYGDIAKIVTPIEPVFKRFLAKDKGRCVLALEATHPLAAAHEALDAQRADVAVQIRDAKRQAESAVNSATTVARLIELWPEIKPFAVKHEGARAPLPALPTATLNALLNLPVTKAA